MCLNFSHKGIYIFIYSNSKIICHFRLTNNLAASLVTVALFSLSQLTWSWSVTAEVFGLNNFFIALLLYLTVLFEETDCPNIKIRVSE